MNLQLNNELQHKIADLLWETSTQNQIQQILDQYGADARVVYYMMVAEAIDHMDDDQLDMANIMKFFRG